MARLAAIGREERLDRGSVLFHQGDTALDIFCLQEGRVRLDRSLEDGQVVTVGVAQGPNLVGEAALFPDSYKCSAIVETKCAVVRVPKGGVLEMLEEDSAFARALLHGLMSEVRNLRTRLELRNVKPAAERLLQFLRLRKELGRPDPDRPLSALAAELGLAPETLYRVVERLESEGRLRRKGKRLALIP